MKCYKVTDSLILSAGRGRLPFKIRLHVLFCRECREGLIHIRREFAALMEMQPFEMKRSTADDVMRKIAYVEPAASEAFYSAQIFKWLAAGITIFISIFLVQYSESLIWLKLYFGSNLEVPFNLVMGFVISVYSIVFIAAHLDKVKKIIHYYEFSHRLDKYIEGIF